MTLNEIRTAIDSLQRELQASFADPGTLSREEAAGIMRRYTASFIGNFMTWLGAGAIASRSADARHAMAENLEVEFRDDHQGMLWDFASAAGALPEAADYLAVHADVQALRQAVADLNGVQLNALAAILESTSLAFVPYLEALALKLSGNAADLRYARVHGEADIAHADQFINALAVEMRRGYADPERDFATMMGLARDLLLTIFFPARSELRVAV